MCVSNPIAIPSSRSCWTTNNLSLMSETMAIFIGTTEVETRSESMTVCLTVSEIENAINAIKYGNAINAITMTWGNHGRVNKIRGENLL